MNKETTINLLVSGSIACFRRPEFAEDLVSYDVMPPTVARRLCEAALSENPVQIFISKIWVLNPVCLHWQHIETARGARRALVLLDVRYVIQSIVRPFQELKHQDWLSRMTRKLANPINVHLGLADFPGTISLVEGEMPKSALSETGAIDLGWMLYDLGRGKRSHFRRFTMQDGQIDLLNQNPSMEAC